jgi:uncharacterized protein (TIGR00661 family)
MREMKRKRVLICPLGWGLGHASRVIPIIEAFLNLGHEVLVAANNQSLRLLSHRFPDIQTIRFPSFEVRLARGKSQTIPLIGVALRLPFHTLKEHFMLRRLIRQYQIDLVISDNRYGLWCQGTNTILITHQLRVLFPKPFRFLEPAGQVFIRWIAERFTACWIPDNQGAYSIAGKLSHPTRLPRNAKYIGMLSRFTNYGVTPVHPCWDLVGIASGPNPHRELLIAEIEKLATRHNLKTLIVKGLPEEGDSIVEKDGICYAGHLGDNEFASVVKTTKYLVCRAGYSTIMDLFALRTRGLLVPTPGQTEQEYLASHLASKQLFEVVQQSKLQGIDINRALRVDLAIGFDAVPPESLLRAMNTTL